MTIPLAPTGDEAALKKGGSVGGDVCQSSLPVDASNGDTIPLIPTVKSLRFWKSGVAFGPAPCAAAAGVGENAAEYPDIQRSVPFVASRAVSTSRPSRRVKL